MVRMALIQYRRRTACSDNLGNLVPWEDACVRRRAPTMIKWAPRVIDGLNKRKSCDGVRELRRWMTNDGGKSNGTDTEVPTGCVLRTCVRKCAMCGTIGLSRVSLLRAGGPGA